MITIGARFHWKNEVFNTKLYRAFEEFQCHYEEKKEEKSLNFTNIAAIKKFFFEHLILSCSAEDFWKRILQPKHLPQVYKQELHQKMHIECDKGLCFDLFYYELFCELMQNISMGCEELLRYVKEASATPLEEMYIKNFIANEVFTYFYDEYDEAEKTYKTYRNAV